MMTLCVIPDTLHRVGESEAVNDGRDRGEGSSVVAARRCNEAALGGAGLGFAAAAVANLLSAGSFRRMRI